MARVSKIAPRKAVSKSEAKSSNGGKPAQIPAAAAPAPLTAPEPAPGAQPAMRILAQYVKDLSFENPNAPATLQPQSKQPDINISVNVNARNLAPTDFEVELHIDAKATVDGKVFFAAEVLYCGVFRMENFPANILHPAVLIECPRMLFPFARQVISDATRNGGFPPLMIDPIDFASMYQKRIQAQGTVGQA
ncbi:protein-export chaperone SecB [Aestuariivirga litoralis]|uniref:protein-export chaperone SecB n=1 Tax=Aestuariivirga litoralis TaxID=2650924 RepID=UPI002485D450|nr:protein-export chaperone SecB [Aestuariivirga litoralis]MBG1233779.1 protein-export chaperone SecB [Aestuariivirga litoralis]